MRKDFVPSSLGQREERRGKGSLIPSSDKIGLYPSCRLQEGNIYFQELLCCAKTSGRVRAPCRVAARSSRVSPGASKLSGACAEKTRGKKRSKISSRRAGVNFALGTTNGPIRPGAVPRFTTKKKKESHVRLALYQDALSRLPRIQQVIKSA